MEVTVSEKLLLSLAARLVKVVKGELSLKYEIWGMNDSIFAFFGREEAQKVSRPLITRIKGKWVWCILESQFPFPL